MAVTAETSDSTAPIRLFSSLGRRSGIAALMLVLGTAPAVSIGGGRPFTIHDSIAFRHITPLTDELIDHVRGGEAQPALFNPTGSQFLVHLTYGSELEGQTIDEIVLFKAKDVQEYLLGRRLRPEPSVVIRAATKRDEGRLSRVRWRSADTISYITADELGVQQLFEVDTDSRQATQVTASPTDVIEYASGKTRVVYWAKAPLLPQQAAIDLSNVDVGSALGAFNTSDYYYPPLQLFSLDRKLHSKAVALVGTRRLADWHQSIWLSPTERYAVAFEPATNWPTWWSRYQVSEYSTYGFSDDKRSDDPQSPDLYSRARYTLIDLEARSTKTLLDAPTGDYSFNSTPYRVFWPAAETQVILTHTFLPLKSDESAEDLLREKLPAIVCVDLDTASEQVIRWEPSSVTTSLERPTTPAEQIVTVSWTGNSLEVGTETRAGGTLQFRTTRYANRDGQWVRSSAPKHAAPVPPIVIKLHQELNEPPTLWGSEDRRRHGEREVLDPNPQLKEINLGNSAVVHWADANHIQWTGGVVYPPGFNVGRRYPLVVQTHGFRKDRFLLDGPDDSTTAFAARAFAGAGFIVLQVENNAFAETRDRREGSYYAEGYRAGIERLVALGEADPAAVGVIGWSATGSYVIELTTRYPELVKAAVVADAMTYSYLARSLSVNGQKLILRYFDKVTGGEPTPVNLGEWSGHNAVYKLGSVATAFRFEAIGAESALDMWEPFSILKSAGKPAQFIYFPLGLHSLVTPDKRIASQLGTLQWMRRWLMAKGEAE